MKASRAADSSSRLAKSLGVMTFFWMMEKKVSINRPSGQYRVIGSGIGRCALFWRLVEVVAGGELAGAVAVRHPGLEHLGAQPFDPAGDDGLADRGDRQGQAGPGLVHRFFVGGADGGGGQRGVAQGHLCGDVILYAGDLGAVT